MKKPCGYPWYDCTVEDIAHYLGIVMWMGIIKLPDMNMYWARNQVFSMPAFSQVMSRTTYQSIGKYFHAFNRRALPKNSDDRLLLIRPVIDYFRDKCKSIYVPEKNLSLDEGMMKWKGRLNIKVYNPKKPIKYGIKFFFLCESKSGFVLDFIIYRGMYQSLRDTVFELMEPHLDKGYHLFMDNYYNSVALAGELHTRGTHCSGTLRISRGAPRELQDIVKRRSLQRGDMCWRKKDNTFVICWQDLRCVSFITTATNAETESFIHRRRVKRNGRFVYEEMEIQRPKMVGDYIAYMGGVDHFDQMINYYGFARRSNRWTKKTTMYLLQLALFNSYALYAKFRPNRNRRCMTLIDFHQHIANSLFFFDESKWPDSGSRIAHAPDLPEDERFDRIPQQDAPPGNVPPQVVPAAHRAPLDPLIAERLAEEAVDDVQDPASPSAAPDAASPPAGPSGALAPRQPTARGHALGIRRPRPRRTSGVFAGPTPRENRRSRRPTPAPAGNIPTATPVQRTTRLLTDHPDRLIPTGTLIGGQRIEHKHVTLWPKGMQKRCCVCVKDEGGRGDTSYGCSHCQVALCTVKGDCFVRYHTLIKYWRGVWPRKRRVGRGRGGRGRAGRGRGVPRGAPGVRA